MSISAIPSTPPAALIASLRMEPLQPPRQQLLGARTLEARGGLVHPRRLLVHHRQRRLVDRLDGVAVGHQRDHLQLERPVAGLAAPPGWIGGSERLFPAERAVERDRARRGIAHHVAPNRASSSSDSPRTNEENVSSASRRRR